ncbi:MAG: 50S ribosomal protein L31 [Mycoplasmataceae bacterium CE_OT135]|nr:MAG: 50S ribosomal protein L31 [Mycoplasmataceae bacterium CE_OT135]
MKKNLHSSLYLINYYCISCHEEYQNYSTSSENKNVNTCANCSPVYKGGTSGQVRMGRAEKFHQRQQKAQAKAEAKNK